MDHSVHNNRDVILYGKEINDETYAICKSDMMISAGATIEKCNYNLIFAQKELRVELEFAMSNKEHNKKLFDFFYE